MQSSDGEGLSQTGDFGPLSGGLFGDNVARSKSEPPPVHLDTNPGNDLVGDVSAVH